MLKFLRNPSMTRGVAAIGTISGLAMLGGAAFTLLPETGLGGVVVTILALLNVIYFGYNAFLLWQRDKQQDKQRDGIKR